MSSIMRIKNEQGEWTSVVSLKGEGVQQGGVTGQYLVKKSNDDFDTEWASPTGGGDMMRSVYDPQGKNTDIFGYVDNKVKTDVPVGAKFTDTTYTEITEAEINTGTASTLRTITARRVTFILSKAQTLVNNAIGALTKSSVGLSNVDNVKQIPMSEKGANNGVAELDSTGKVLSSQLPSYIEADKFQVVESLPASPASGTFYFVKE